MARRKSHRPSQRANDPDLLDDLVNEVVTRPRPPAPLVRPAQSKQPIEADRRTNWAPTGPGGQTPRVPVRDFAGRNARIVYKAKAPKPVSRAGGNLKAPGRFWPGAHLDKPRFASASSVNICRSRKVKREVLHALRRTKSGAGAPKRRNHWSDVRC